MSKRRKSNSKTSIGLLAAAGVALFGLAAITDSEEPSEPALATVSSQEPTTTQPTTTEPTTTTQETTTQPTTTQETTEEQVQQFIAPPEPEPEQKTSYANCREVWDVLGRPIYPSDPGYTAGPRKLDGNSDGVGCEQDPR